MNGGWRRPAGVESRGHSRRRCTAMPGSSGRGGTGRRLRATKVYLLRGASIFSQSAMSYVGSGEKIGRLCSEASGPPDRKRPLINDTAPRHVRTRPPRRENLNNNNACPPLLAAIICSHTMTTAAHYYLFAAARMAARRSLTVQCRPRQCSPCLARKRQKVEPRRVASSSWW